MTVEATGPGVDSATNGQAETPRRGGGLYFGANLISQAAALLRYIVMARILGPEELGLAATLAITGAFFDMISDTGADRFIIQDRHGGTVEVQKLVQLVMVGRGVLVAVCLIIFAIPIAHFYRAPRLAVALAILALSPLIGGFQHLDMRRDQRGHDFRSQAICMAAGELAGLAATVAATWLTQSFTAILFGLITRSLVMTLASHMLARRPYGLTWNRQDGPRLIRFATPLMFSGLLLFLITQGDRVIIGNQLGAKSLGLYSAIFLLIYYPSALLGAYLNAIYVPLIAAQRDSPSARAEVLDRLEGQNLLLAAAMAAGFALVTPAIAPLLFGARFAQDALLVGLIGVLQMTRFLFNSPVTAALALGRSTTILASNLTHAFAFAGALLGLRILGGLQGLMVGFIVGEIIALALTQLLSNRDQGRGRLAGFSRLGTFAMVCGGIVGWNLALRAGLWPAEAGLAIATVVLTVWLSRRESAVIIEALVWARRSVSPLMLRIGFRP